MTFAPGTSDGAIMCIPVTVHSDNLVESEEDFMMMLALVNPGHSVILAKNTSVVTVIDNDGKTFSLPLYT